MVLSGVSQSKPNTASRWNWRRSLRNWHRDLGFVGAALTVVYAVSGLAVNHRGDWDYNRSTVTKRYDFGTPAALLPGLSTERRRELSQDPASITSQEEAELAREIGTRIGSAQKLHNTLWRNRYTLAIHFSPGDADRVEYDVRTGEANRSLRKDRVILRQLNLLHLNERRGWWTFVADAYAGVMLFLAISGVLMLKGRRGLAGRGGPLLIVGLLVPVGAMLLFGLL